jgi:hypothetical protein
MTQINLPKSDALETHADNIREGNWFIHKFTLHYMIRSSYKDCDALCIRDNKIIRLDGGDVVKPVDVTIDVKYRY